MKRAFVAIGLLLLFGMLVFGTVLTMADGTTLTEEQQACLNSNNFPDCWNIDFWGAAPCDPSDPDCGNNGGG